MSSIVVGQNSGVAAPTDGLSRLRPEEVGLSSGEVLAFLNALSSNNVEMNSFMLFRHGKVAAEGYWWPYAPDRIHMLHSVTKALTSTGVGLAIGEGRFRLEDPVVSFFPDQLPAKIPANLAAMTVEHLVTQTSGHAASISGSVWRGIKTSWIDEFFKVPVEHAPGSFFKYSSATSFMLSAIITRTTGLSLHDYLKPRILDPLGMDKLRWDVGPEGINPGGNGASATTSEFLKIMALYCAGGMWNGRQLLAEDWARSAGQSKFGNPYGYHWWISPDGSGFYAFGAFGQYGIIFPELGVTMVTFAAVPGSISRPDEVLPPLIWKHVPRMCKAAPAEPKSAALVRQRTENLRLLPSLTRSQSSMASSVSGRRFAAESNVDGVIAISVEFRDDRCIFKMETTSGVHQIEAGLGHWIEGTTSMPGAGLHHGYEPSSLRVVAGGEWKQPDTFEMSWQFVESSFRDTVRLRFGDNSVAYDRSVNVNGAGTTRPEIKGFA